MIGKSFIVVVAAVACAWGAAVWAAESPVAVVKAPGAAEVKARLGQWLDERQADEATRGKVEAIFAQLPDEPSELDLLAAAANSLAAVDPQAADLVAMCAKPKDRYILPQRAWLADEQTPDFVANNLRLHYARWLVHEEMFDEAMEQLAGLDPADVVAPATLLFYQGVAQHTLLDREGGLKTLARLLAGSEQSPRRYVALARLLEEDLKTLEDESLDHIARRMGDVRRKLNLGKAGKRVREQEDGIIESLDKIIKKLEEQQQAAAAAAGMQDNIRSSSPAPDSMPIGGKGQGDVQKRNVGSSSDWGSLPPAEREKALQQIGRDFPPHFRDVIEQYFRRLASEDSD
jgi:hypothetical protein